MLSVCVGGHNADAFREFLQDMLKRCFQRGPFALISFMAQDDAAFHLRCHIEYRAEIGA